MPTHRVCSGKLSAIRQLDALPNTAATVHPIPFSFTCTWGYHWDANGWVGINSCCFNQMISLKPANPILKVKAHESKKIV